MGLLVQSRGSHQRKNVIRLVPPLVCTDAEIDQGMSILAQALRGVSPS
jgi:4-aminobutyrate aminotransferase-like enzyme